MALYGVVQSDKTVTAALPGAQESTKDSSEALLGAQELKYDSSAALHGVVQSDETVATAPQPNAMDVEISAKPGATHAGFNVFA